MLIFDIGCNAGQWILANYNKDVRFVGVEANPDIYRKAYNRFQGYPNVDIINYLAGAKTGKLVKFYPEVNDPSGVASTASPAWIKDGRFSDCCLWPHHILKPSISLDTLIDIYGLPDYIKIDVEGYEFEVLRGLSQVAGRIAFEWTEEGMVEMERCVRYLYVLGYTRFNWLVNSDDYTYWPADMIELNDLMMKFEDLNPKNKIMWGMIYADI